MSWWLWVVCVLVGVVLWRATFRFMLGELLRECCGGRRVDGFDIVIGTFLATLGFWFMGPCLLGSQAIVAVMRTVHPSNDWAGVARALGGESRAEKLERLEREAKLREIRIAKLEQELGL